MNTLYWNVMIYIRYVHIYVELEFKKYIIDKLNPQEMFSTYHRKQKQNSATCNIRNLNQKGSAGAA